MLVASCVIEAAGSGERLGCVDILSSMLDVNQSCWLDLQRLVFATVRAKFFSKSSEMSVACVRILDGHNGPEMTTCEFSKSAVQACVKAWLGWTRRVASSNNSNNSNNSNVLAVGLYLQHVVYKASIERGWTDLRWFSGKTRKNWLADVSVDGRQLRFKSMSVQNDEVFVRAAVGQTCLALCYASVHMQGQYDMFLLALQTYSHTLTCHWLLRDNFYAICRQHCVGLTREKALQVVCLCGMMLQHLPRELQHDPDIALAAVRQDQGAFTFVKHSRSLNCNKLFMLQAMEVSSQARLHVAHQLEFAQNDQDEIEVRNLLCRHGDALGWNLVCKHGDALAFLKHSDVAFTKDFVVDQVSKNAWALQHAGVFKNDKDVVEIAVRAQGQALQFAHSSLRARKRIVMAAVCSDGLALQFACEALRNSQEVVFAAIKQNVYAYKFALGFEMREHEHTLYYALEHSIQAIRFIEPYCMTIDSQIKRTREQLQMFAVRHHVDALKELRPSQRSKTVLLEALKAFPQALVHVASDDLMLIGPCELAKHFGECVAAKHAVSDEVDKVDEVDEAVTAAVSCCSKELCMRSVTQVFAMLAMLASKQNAS